MEFLFLIIIGIIIYSGVQAARKMTNGSIAPQTQKRAEDLSVFEELPEEMFTELSEYNEMQESDHPEAVAQCKATNDRLGQTARKEIKKESPADNRKIKIQSKEEARRAIIYSEIIRRKY